MHLGIVLARLGRASEALALEGEAADLARKQGNKALEADVAIATAEILLASGAADLAIEKAERARSLTDTPALSAAAASVLAHALSARGRTEEALVAAKEAVALLDANEGLEDVELAVRLAHAEALHATGDVDGARSALSTARGLLDRRANAIVDAKSRARFLERVPINARILQLAATWLESGP
jgi:ATP/maltotriose-dependent transcriptional regulator MalT